MVGVEEKYEEDYYDPDEAEENDDGNEEEINNMVVAIESNPSSDDSNPLQGSDNSQVHRNKSHHQQQQGPGVQYLTYVPSSGWTSQFHGMLRAAILARSLNRTLVLPPITAVNHDSNQAPDTQSWSSFFDLETFMHHTGVKIVDVQELHGPDQIPSTFGSPKCYITNGIGSLRPLDSTARAFLSQYKFDPSMSELEVETCELSELPSAFENMKSERLLCITGAHNMIVPRSQEWDQYGRYLYFAPLVQEFYEKVLRQLRDQMLGNHHIDRDQTIRVSRQRYIIIQARRDDEHSKNCQQHFQHALSNCLPTSQELASTLRGLLIADPSLRGLPVFVSTNENRAKELAEFKEYGWQILDHQDLRTQEQLGIFGPMMIDQLFMMNAQVVVGGKTSSVGAYRR
ncbi:GDP-fucose protein O-fucosyltransferase-domain-containing protein [Mortierella sp. GBAus27b]|nr:hypothetical protein BGX31_007842 [Mortierella sp. GBA43]KAI8347300.1 GDP-fucose protein O-fucosyltransferase-domain-containing protein [Mortierella sp. GBAus27b]